MTTDSIKSLEKKISDIKNKIAQIGDIRPGSLSKQYNVCGKPHCRCKAEPPQKHGPYYQVSFTFKGKSGTRFIKESELDTIQQQINNFKQLKQLYDNWIELGLRLSNLKLALLRKS